MAKHRLSRAMISAYADLSHDRNPLHLDDEVARASPFGGVVAHGFLLLTGALNVAGAEPRFPKTIACRFSSPGRPGDELETAVDPDGGFRILCGERVLVEGRIDV